MRPFHFVDRFSGPKPHRGFGCFANPECLGRFADPDPRKSWPKQFGHGEWYRIKARANHFGSARALLLFYPEGRVFGPLFPGSGETLSPQIGNPAQTLAQSQKTVYTI